MTAVMTLLGALLLGAAALGAVVVGGTRAKWPPVVETVRRLNLRVMNPRQLRTAGGPGAYAGILRHTGRTSGAAYQTPLGIEPTDDGFVIMLVYGDRTQWLKNVLAAGTAEVVVEGETYRVDRPAVVPFSEVANFFPASDRRLSGVMAIKNALRLYRCEP